MKLKTLALLAGGAAAGYVVARSLLDREEPPAAVPVPLQPLVTCLHTRLRAAGDAATDALAEGRRERDAAETALRAEYLKRTGRTDRAATPTSG